MKPHFGSRLFIVKGSSPGTTRSVFRPNRAIRRDLIRRRVVGDLDFEGFALDARETSEEAVEARELELLRGGVGGRPTPKLAFPEKATLDLKLRLLDFLAADFRILALLRGVDERSGNGLDCE